MSEPPLEARPGPSSDGTVGQCEAQAKAGSTSSAAGGPPADAPSYARPTRTRPEIVCFDLGGVLVRLVPGWAEACQLASVPMRGAPDHRRAVELGVLHAKGQLSDAEWAKEQVAAGAPYTAEELLRILHVWIRGEYDDVDRVVARLHSQGIATACLSNTSEGHWRRMVHRDGDARLAGPPEFPTVASLGWQLASHRLGAAKPERDIYEAFESSTGYRGSQILFFDDLGVNVEAARSLGWNSETLDPTQPTAPQIRAWLDRYGLG